jgi:alpha-D-ribose 1-methylphosphonate 5-phosphate C-P lyase
MLGILQREPAFGELKYGSHHPTLSRILGHDCSTCFELMNPAPDRNQCARFFAEGRDKVLVNITQFHCFESEKFNDHALFDLHAE